MSTMKDKIRAMLNGNGRTAEEAAAFRAKAGELIKKHGLEAEFVNEPKAEPKAGKAKKAKAPKQPKVKPVKDDGRLRQVLVKNTVTGKWSIYRTVTQPQLKAFLKGLREQGFTVKSKVIK